MLDRYLDCYKAGRRPAVPRGGGRIRARARRSGRPLALALLDLDHFKQVPEGGEEAALARTFLHLADERLYAATALGRNLVVGPSAADRPRTLAGT